MNDRTAAAQPSFLSKKGKSARAGRQWADRSWTPRQATNQVKSRPHTNREGRELFRPKHQKLTIGNQLARILGMHACSG